MTQLRAQDKFKNRWLRRLGGLKGVRGRDRVLRFFADPDTHPSERFEIESMGTPYTGDLNNFIDWYVFYYGAHAESELRLLAKLAEALRAKGRPVNFYDVGANIGGHTLFMTQHSDHVYAFEPFAPVRAEMARKLAHANATRVTVFPVALGDKMERGSYCPPTGANQGTGTLGELLPENAADERIGVEVVRGDEFLQEQHLPPISLLKMDVEGYEEKALEGLRETLRRDRPPMLMELQADVTADGSKNHIIDNLLYPDHLIYEVRDVRGHYQLKPFRGSVFAEVLVLPKELAGIV